MIALIAACVGIVASFASIVFTYRVRRSYMEEGFRRGSQLSAEIMGRHIFPLMIERGIHPIEVMRALDLGHAEMQSVIARIHRGEAN